jgi:hypothetical protein
MSTLAWRDALEASLHIERQHHPFRVGTWESL